MEDPRKDTIYSDFGHIKENRWGLTKSRAKGPVHLLVAHVHVHQDLAPPDYTNIPPSSKSLHHSQAEVTLRKGKFES